MRIVVEDRDTAGKKDCYKNLWDDISYSLPVTERSIEALVDYYDYLCKFEAALPVETSQPEKTVEVQAKTDKTGIEQAIEDVVRRFLNSDEAGALIKSAQGSEKAVAPDARETKTRHTNPENAINELVEKVKSLNDSFSASLSTDQLCQLFDELQEYSTKNKIAIALMDNEDNEDVEPAEIDKTAATIYKNYSKASNLLLVRIFNDIRNSGGVDLVGMYRDINKPSKK